MDLNTVIFKKKTFSSLLEDIYKNSKEKDEKIKVLIEQVKEMIKTPADAVMVVPVLKDYLDMSIKNDDSLIKMAGIVQKAINATSAGEGADYLTEKEKQELFDEIKKIELT